MHATILTDYIKSTIVKTRCGLASFWCNRIIQFNQESFELEILLSNTVDIYDNTHLLPKIQQHIHNLTSNNKYKITNTDIQQYNQHVIVKIIFRPLRGECVKIHKHTTYYFTA
jgi:hypothetical protein